MSIVSQKRGGLALFGSPIHASSHRIRLVCQAKDLEIDYVEIDPDNIPSDLIEINPTGRLPTLIDLDERFPHPALMPIEANLKAKIRLFCYELETNWYQPVDQLQHGKLSPAKKKAPQKQLRESVLLMSPMFKGRDHLIGSEISLLDCCVLPILWRLESLEIELPKAAATIQRYMDFHFSKDYFRKSLSKQEAALRPGA